MKVFHTEDNTILFCPSASYRYNYGTHKKYKIILIIISSIGIIGFLFGVFFSSDARLQTLFATLIGGLMNVVVWVATSFVSDKIKKEQDEIDRLIYIVNRHIKCLNTKVTFIKPLKYEFKQVDDNNTGVRFLSLLQFCVDLISEKDIDSSHLKIKWEGKDYSLSDFYSYSENLLQQKKLNLDDEHVKMIEWNFHEIKNILHRKTELKQFYI